MQTLQKKLCKVLSSDESGHLVCLPPIFRDTTDLIQSSRRNWHGHLIRFRKTWYNHIIPKKIYGNAFVSRPYMTILDKTKAGETYALWKTLWQGRNIVLVEGEKSRMSVGNDLFSGAISVLRILGPSINAFDRYDQLLETVLRRDCDDLILLALGPTATVLALDLHRQGYQALDIGHVDVEYEWFRMGTTRKMPLQYKYVNEVEGGNPVGDLLDQKYLSQIIGRVP